MYVLTDLLVLVQFYKHENELGIAGLRPIKRAKLLLAVFADVVLSSTSSSTSLSSSPGHFKVFLLSMTSGSDTTCLANGGVLSFL